MRDIMAAMFLCAAATATATEIPGSGGVPDLTKGGELTRINKRWAGPVGIFCGAWRPVNGRDHAHQLKYVRQLLVLEVDKGSPADGVLEVNDVILGADGTGAAGVPLFEGGQWAMIPIAEAITEAETRDPALLKLLIWRPIDKAGGGSTDGAQNGGGPTLGDVGDNPLGDLGPDLLDDLDADPKKEAVKDETAAGKIETVTIELESLGRYSDTAPYGCQKSQRILRKGIKALYESDKPGEAYLGALCLLAADDPTNPGNDRYQAKAKEWVYKLVEEDFGSPWFSGPRLIALSEYYMKTKDEAVFPELARRAEHHASGVSWIGTTGHRWADKLSDGSSGRISGYGAINCSGVLGFLGLSLARKAGVNSPVVIAANERQRIFFGHYAEKGRIIYGEYCYGINGGTGDENGRHAMPALALGLHEGQEEKAKYFSRMTALATVGNRTYAHGGPYFGTVWQPVAAAQGGVKLANFHFQEIRWHLDLKRHWNGRRIFDPTHNSYGRFSEDATALLFYALPLKQLYVTGRGHSKALQLSDAEFAETVATKTFDESTMTSQELIDSLSQYLGMLRGRAAAELGKRVQATNGSEEGAAIIRALIALAADKKASPTGRGGACRALMDIKSKAQEPVSALMNAEIAKTGVDMLKEPDPYIRYGGGRVLLSLRPEDVRPYGNDILDAIIASDRPTFPLDEENPCRWDHGVMGDVLVKKVLSQGLDGVDRQKLVPVLTSLLSTPEAGARTVVAKGIHNLTIEETLGIAGSIVECMKQGAPVNAAMDGAASVCQELLAEHAFEEALPLSLRYGTGKAVKNRIPQKYGLAALTMDSSREIMQAIGEQMLVQAVEGSEQVIDQIQKGTAPGKLNKLKRIHSVKAVHPTLTLPSAQTELVVDATNYALPAENATTYTWRKVYGAGKVSFAPNASGQSKTTTVAFTDRRPGKYRFEVAMSDTLGYNVLRKTVDVTLYDERGKLPANRPPQAISQSIEAVPGLPVRVVLSGTDPDGDDLGFIVTRQPAHGRLSGVGGELTYTADFGHSGTSRSTAEIADGQAGPGAPARVPLPGTDPDGDDLGSILNGGPSQGSLSGAGGDLSDTAGRYHNWPDRFTFEVVDGQGEASAGTVDIRVSDQNVGVVVYEGFDYPLFGVEGREGGSSFGFARPWRTSRGTMDRYVVANGSLSYPDLPSTGGKLTGGPHTSCSRALDPEVLSAHKLLDDGRELWFSVFVEAPGGQGRLQFGLKGGGAEGGPDLGFKIAGYGIHATHNGEEAGTARNPWSRAAGLRFSEKAPNMIIGRCVWGKTDRDPDTLEIYRVFDAPEFGPMVLREPACVLEEAIPQAGISSVYYDGIPAIDEIRIGPTLHSVMVGTKPLAAKSE